VIFVDTWAWIAMSSRRDQFHSSAVSQHKQFLKSRRKYVTTDYVLSETVTQLYQILSPSEAEVFVRSILRSVELGDYLLYFIDEARFQEAWVLRLRYRDKPGISFVDLTSMAVMRELGLTDVFTGDTHFQKVGLGFRLFPDPDAATTTRAPES
jgi:predicted nucleic acid-binding protein